MRLWASVLCPWDFTKLAPSIRARGSEPPLSANWALRGRREVRRQSRLGGEGAISGHQSGVRARPSIGRDKRPPLARLLLKLDTHPLHQMILLAYSAFDSNHLSKSEQLTAQTQHTPISSNHYPGILFLWYKEHSSYLSKSEQPPTKTRLTPTSSNACPGTVAFISNCALKMQ